MSVGEEEAVRQERCWKALDLEASVEQAAAHKVPIFGMVTRHLRVIPCRIEHELWLLVLFHLQGWVTTLQRLTRILGLLCSKRGFITSNHLVA
jgi:hypothetical protein